MKGFTLVFSKSSKLGVSSDQLKKIQKVFNIENFSSDNFFQTERLLGVQYIDKKNNTIGYEKNFYDYEMNILILGDVRIDNSAALQNEYKDLKALDYKQIILNLYKNLGDKLYSIIEGPFAFVIIDINKHILSGGRDLFGQVPLYYSEDKDKIIFSTDVKIFFAFGISKTYNYAKIYQFILSEHLKDGNSFYEDINKINGGMCFRYSKKNEMCISKYLEPSSLIFDYEKKYQNSINEFRFIFENTIDSIVKKINSNFGSTLSGGLDSSSVALVCNKFKDGKELFSYSVHFHGLSESEFKKTDELKYVKEVVSHAGLKHKYINLDFDHDGPINKKINTKLENQPYGVINGYVHERIYDECKKDNIRFLFDGLFGDEIISHGVFRLNELSKKGKIIKLIRELVLLRRNRTILSLRNQLKSTLFLPLFRMFSLPFNFKNFLLINLNDYSSLIKTSDKKTNIFKKTYISSRKFYFKSDIDEQLKLFDSGLIEFSLEQMYEISAMRNIECIYPFLDKRIISHSLSFPSSLKLRNGITRYFFRESMKNILPKKIYKRLSKANISPYAKNQIINNYDKIIRSIFNQDSQIKKFIEYKDLNAILNKDNLSINDILIVYNLYCLNDWLKQ